MYYSVFQEYLDYEIPAELTYLWNYMANAYASEAFLKSCPADKEIILFYKKKAKKVIPMRKIWSLKDHRSMNTPLKATVDEDSEEESC